MTRRRCRSERGDAAVETVLAVPVLLFLILVVIQAGLWFHGSQLVEAAAQEGMQAGRVQQVIPGLRLTVSGAAEGPTERFREDR